MTIVITDKTSILDLLFQIQDIFKYNITYDKDHKIILEKRK